MDFKKEKQAELRKQERQWGIHVPDSVRRLMEDMAGAVHDDDDLEYFKSTLTDYMTLIAAVLGHHMVNDKKRHSANELGEATNRKRYQRSFEKRLHLVGFVSAKVLGLENLVDWSFTPHKRIKWGQVCNKWNKEHPYDLMTPAVLKATYYRAITEADIQREYFNRRYREIEILRKELREPITDPIVELMARAMPVLRSGRQVAIQIARGLGYPALCQPDFRSLVAFFKIYLGLSDSEKEEHINLLKAGLQSQTKG